ncbi:putative SP-containing protein [Vairimorpha necatrix]|uniref:SP-containing protein n=1 Tax=Vairimorpha necatrix TaxID=6039 RepID=A0AAX4J9J3_9MICR
MYLFISLLNCFHCTAKTNETNLKSGQDHIENSNDNINIMKILSEGNNEIDLNENRDPSMEKLFEYLVNGGDYEQYKKSTCAIKHFFTPDVLFKSNKVDNHTTLEQQLYNMREKLDRITEECQLYFSKVPENKIKIIFNRQENKKISYYRHFISKFFLYFKRKISNHIANIADNIEKTKFSDCGNVMSVLHFVKAVFDFLKPKINSLRLNDDSLLLLYEFSLVNWKILMVMNIINVPDLILNTYNYCHNRMPNKTSNEACILDELVFLKNKLSYIYNQKDFLSSRLYKICQIIAESHNKRK